MTRQRYKPRYYLRPNGKPRLHWEDIKHYGEHSRAYFATGQPNDCHHHASQAARLCLRIALYHSLDEQERDFWYWRAISWAQWALKEARYMLGLPGSPPAYEDNRGIPAG